MLFSWHLPQRHLKHHESAAMPGRGEGHVSKGTGHLKDAKKPGHSFTSHLWPRKTPAKASPACQPSGEWDGVSRGMSSESCNSSMVPTQAEEATARAAAPRGQAACSALPAPGTPWHHVCASSLCGSGQTAPTASAKMHAHQRVHLASQCS